MASGPADLTVRSGRVRHARRLATRAFRAETGEFLAEGPQAVREALLAEGVTREVFATAPATGRHAELRASAERAAVPWHVVTDQVLDAIADTVRPQGIAARCTTPQHALVELLDQAPTFLVLCADIRDPGNAGAVIRCADAAGADGVVFVGDSVDPFNPKSVRASVGSVFHLPVVVVRNIPTTIEMVREAGLQLLAADGDGGTELFDAELDLAAPTAWLMGNEAWGLPQATLGLVDEVVAVPIYGRAESLNLAAAAAVCLYTTARSRAHAESSAMSDRQK